jgi:hypothetical protein
LADVPSVRKGRQCRRVAQLAPLLLRSAATVSKYTNFPALHRMPEGGGVMCGQQSLMPLVSAVTL